MILSIILQVYTENKKQDKINNLKENDNYNYKLQELNYTRILQELKELQELTYSHVSSMLCNKISIGFLSQRC